MKDALGQEIVIGDDVVICGGYYAAAKFGKVSNVAKQKVTIDQTYRRVDGLPDLTRKSSRWPNTLVVVTKLMPITKA